MSRPRVGWIATRTVGEGSSSRASSELLLVSARELPGAGVGPGRADAEAVKAVGGRGGEGRAVDREASGGTPQEEVLREGEARHEALRAAVGRDEGPSCGPEAPRVSGRDGPAGDRHAPASGPHPGDGGAEEVGPVAVDREEGQRPCRRDGE